MIDIATLKFTEFKSKSNDYIYHLYLDKFHSVEIIHVFNNSTTTYMGYKMDVFIDSLKFLLGHFPTILDDIDDGGNIDGVRKALAKHGFIKRDMTEIEKVLADFKYNV